MPTTPTRQQQLANLSKQANDLQRTLVSSVQSGQISGEVVRPNTASTPGRVRNKPRIVSSNSVLDQKQIGDAVNQAGNALTTNAGYNPYSAMQGLQQQFVNTTTAHNNQNNKDFQSLINAQNLVFNASLRRTDSNYADNLSELETSYKQMTDVATANAAALNPYSQAAGATTADNFNNQITTNYQKQVAKATQQAELARQELAAGNHQAYLNISQNMKKSNQEFQTNMMEFMMGSQNQINTQQNADRSFGLQSQEFGFKKEQTHESNFMDFINNFNANPQMKTDIEAYKQTGTISESLVPLVEQGRLTGRSIEEVLAVASYETLNQAKLRLDQQQFASQQQLGWFNAQTSRISATNSGGGGGGGGNPVQENGFVNTDPTVRRALEQALAGKGVTKTQAASVASLFDSQGLKGVMSWSVENKMGETNQQIYQQYANAANVLDNVSNQFADAQFKAGPYKALAEKAKPWLTIQKDQRYADMFQQIEIAQAQVRRGFYGTAVTVSEAGNANRFLINDSDSMATIKMKLENLSGLLRFANDYNAASGVGIQDTIKVENYISGGSSRSQVPVTFGLPGSTPQANQATPSWSYVP